jgi:hypothetical protein
VIGHIKKQKWFQRIPEIAEKNDIIHQELLIFRPHAHSLGETVKKNLILAQN